MADHTKSTSFIVGVLENLAKEIKLNIDVCPVIKIHCIGARDNAQVEAFKIVAAQFVNLDIIYYTPDDIRRLWRQQAYINEAEFVDYLYVSNCDLIFDLSHAHQAITFPHFGWEYSRFYEELNAIEKRARGFLHKACPIISQDKRAYIEPLMKFRLTNPTLFISLDVDENCATALRQDIIQ